MRLSFHDCVLNANWKKTTRCRVVRTMQVRNAIDGGGRWGTQTRLAIPCALDPLRSCLPLGYLKKTTDAVDRGTPQYQLEHDARDAHDERSDHDKEVLENHAERQQHHT